METKPMEILIIDNDYDLRFIAPSRIELRELVNEYIAEHLADYVSESADRIEFTGLGWSSNVDTLWVEYTIDGEPAEYGFDITYQSFDAITK